MNRIVRQALQEGSLNFLYPDSTWVWFASGTTDQKTVNMRALVDRDMLTLGALASKKHAIATALVLYNDPILEYVQKAAAMLQAWELVVVGDETLQFEDSIVMAANSSEMLVIYGEPTEQQYEISNKFDLPILDRSVARPEVLRQDITVNEGDPYMFYWNIVEQLRSYSVRPFQGLKTRDIINYRPQGLSGRN